MLKINNRSTRAMWEVYSKLKNTDSRAMTSLCSKVNGDS